MANLLLDGHKLAHHFDRVKAWEAGERIAPVSVDMALGRQCQASCRGCYAVLQESQERSQLKWDHLKGLIEDFATIGVRGVSLVSDGESTLHPNYGDFIELAHKSGISVGNATNGWRFFPELADRVLPHLEWVRFTVLAGRPEAYLRMMHDDQQDKEIYWTAMQNISQAVAIKRKKNLPVTLGIQTFVTPQDVDEIIPFARLAIDLGVDYAMVKHTSDDESGANGVDYSAYGPVMRAIREAEKLSTPQTLITAKWSKLSGEASWPPPYRRVYGCAFLLQLSGSGLVAPSGMFFNARHSKLHIGDFTQERFIDIWRSDRYWRAQNYLASPAFDAATMMGSLPIQHYANVALDRHVRGIERIQPAVGEAPLHVNFL